MKKIIAILLSLAMMLVIIACDNEKENTSEESLSNNQAYTVDVGELDPNIYPEAYPLITFSEFESDFEELKEANVSGKLDSYEDIVNIFGVDGAYYENCDNDYNGTLYKYYGWYADNGVSILITFKAEKDKLEYFAYTTNGII